MWLSYMDRKLKKQSFTWHLNYISFFTITRSLSLEHFRYLAANKHSLLLLFCISLWIWGKSLTHVEISSSLDCWVPSTFSHCLRIFFEHIKNCCHNVCLIFWEGGWGRLKTCQIEIISLLCMSALFYCTRVNKSFRARVKVSKRLQSFARL